MPGEIDLNRRAQIGWSPMPEEIDLNRRAQIG